MPILATPIKAPREFLSAVPSKPAAVCGDHVWGAPELSGMRMSFARNSEIFGAGEPAEYIYVVLDGVVRSYKILSDGRRQITRFSVPSDVLEIETTDEHTLSAEASNDCTVLMVRRSRLLALAERDNVFARHLWKMTATELRRSQEHGLLLIKSARERVATFLLEMSRRLPSEHFVELPMSRQEIADYLGLTIETVSRTLTSLSQTSTIERRASRQIVLRNRSALSRLND